MSKTGSTLSVKAEWRDKQLVIYTTNTMTPLVTAPVETAPTTIHVLPDRILLVYVEPARFVWKYYDHNGRISGPIRSIPVCGQLDYNEEFVRSDCGIYDMRTGLQVVD